ncbi:MAG: DUF4124 domain-containing protein [Gammaproteobacteria bacterium]|nr:DUF4124 domain-containing protein [Gammaproteobacteria bacterium]
MKTIHHPSSSLRPGRSIWWGGLAVWALAGAMSAAQAGGVTFYKWTDEAGVPQFSGQPPAGVDSEVITVRTQAPATPKAEGSPDESAPAAGEGDGTGEDVEGETKTVPVPPDPEAVAAARQQNCQAARKELESLSNSPRLRARGADGEVTWIQGEERETRLDAARAAVSRFCE